MNSKLQTQLDEIRENTRVSLNKASQAALFRDADACAAHLNDAGYDSIADFIRQLARRGPGDVS